MATPRKKPVPPPIPPRDGEDPPDPDSLTNKVTLQDEVDYLADHNLGLVNIFEAEQRIGLMCRVVIEYGLRSRGKLTLREKMDFSLRAITTLEGTKNTVEWREELRKRQVAPRDTEAYAKERAQVERRLVDILTRKKDLERADAERALAALENEADAHAD